MVVWNNDKPGEVLQSETRYISIHYAFNEKKKIEVRQSFGKFTLLALANEMNCDNISFLHYGTQLVLH